MAPSNLAHPLLLLAGLLGAAVNQVKFGMLFGLPMADHVWTHLNIHRQQFLAALDGISVDDLCRRAEAGAVFGVLETHSDFTI